MYVVEEIAEFQVALKHSDQSVAAQAISAVAVWS